MRSVILLAAGILLSGCAVPEAFPIPKVGDKDAPAAKDLPRHDWGKHQFAPDNYAGFAYDATGVYFNLHGKRMPELLLVSFSVNRVFMADPEWPPDRKSVV